jgi:adenylosuccinate lyase
MTIHIMDSEVHGAGFAPPEMAAVFSDRRRLQSWLDVEVALAQSQAELGLIPGWAAEEIALKARLDLLDLAAVARDTAQAQHFLVPVLRAFERVCERGAGQYIHLGATTQDIVDTGMMLQVRDAWPLLRRDLEAIRASLAERARRHRATPMVGRTHGQQALPITLGYKIAVWVDEIDRQLERVGEAERRVLVGNISGAVGTFSSFGPRGLEIQSRTLARLGLGAPRICWHSSRDRVVEIACLLTQVTGTLGKIANEVRLLQQSEVDELREPFHLGKVGSSTMPHKQNPSTCELIVALARLVRGTLVPLTDAAFQEHERDAACWRIEWAALPEAWVYAGAVLHHMRGVADGLGVLEDRMARNLDLLGGLLLSERVMLALGQRIGKQTAHEVVYDVAMRAQREGVAFREALLADTRVAPHLDRATLEALLDPRAYLGLAPDLVDRIVGAA